MTLQAADACNVYKYTHYLLCGIHLAKYKATAMLQVAVFGARLLARLSVVGAVARFQEAAEELARMHALNASPDPPATQVCSSVWHYCASFPYFF